MAARLATTRLTCGESTGPVEDREVKRRQFQAINAMLSVADTNTFDQPEYYLG